MSHEGRSLPLIGHLRPQAPSKMGTPDAAPVENQGFSPGDPDLPRPHWFHTVAACCGSAPNKCTSRTRLVRAATCKRGRMLAHGACLAERRVVPSFMGGSLVLNSWGRAYFVPKLDKSNTSPSVQKLDKSNTSPNVQKLNKISPSPSVQRSVTVGFNAFLFGKGGERGERKRGGGS